MDYQTPFFAAMALVFFQLWVRAKLRTINLIDAATLEHRIVLDYIAEERCSMPHEFAACWLDGNQAAIERKFPDFKHFRTARLDEIAYKEYAQ